MEYPIDQPEKRVLTFIEGIGILRKLQEMMIYLLSCEEMNQSEETRNLFNFFDKICISNNFAIYEGFLRLFVHLSVYFNLKENESLQHQQIYYDILLELKRKHFLKDRFHQSTLRFIFQYNKHFLLFLVLEGILHFSLIEREIEIHNNRNLLLFFYPEIKKNDPEFLKKQMSNFCVTSEEISSIYGNSIELEDEEKRIESQQYYFEQDTRKEIHSNLEVAKIIRNDDLNSFLKLVSRCDDFNFNSQIPPFCLENNPDVNNEWNYGLSLLEYSMAFGAINIFRYLFVNKAIYLEKSFTYAIMGGNYEILHILEEEPKYRFYDNFYYDSIKYYKQDMNEYFYNNCDIPPKIAYLFATQDEAPYFSIFSKYFGMEYHQEENQDELKKYELDIDTILGRHMFNCPIPPLFIFSEFFYKSSNNDLNSNNMISLFVKYFF